MIYITIEAARKDKCPQEIKGPWDIYRIPHEIWEVCWRDILPKGTAPKDCADLMDEKIIKLSEIHPKYFWNWYPEEIEGESLPGPFEETPLEYIDPDLPF